MAQWANTLDIADAWAKAYDREIAPPEFCRLVANKLKDMAFKAKYAYMADRRDELADAFMDFNCDDVTDEDWSNFDVVNVALSDEARSLNGVEKLDFPFQPLPGETVFRVFMAM